MNKKLSKSGLLLIALINIPYVLFLISGLEPNPVTNEKVTDNSQFVIVLSVLFALLCIAGLFVREKHLDKYRICSNILAVLRVFAGEFGAFWVSFYFVWQEEGVKNPLTIFTEMDIPGRFLALGVILLLFSLPLIGHTSALLCFEYGLEKENRMKQLRMYKIFLVCMAIVALIGIAVTGAVLYCQTV